MITNKDLHQKKIKSLDQSLISLEKTFTLSCEYHGVPLVFHTKNEEFYQELNSYLPKSWKQSTEGFEIFITSFKEYGFDINAWSLEESQDCFFEDDCIIQRDFAAKFINENSISLIIDEKICDGLFNFLRWYLPLELMKVNKIILHSSCILDSRMDAHFFLGHSGAGKTTITELSTPRVILGDDMNLLSFDKENITAQAGAIGGYFKPQVKYDEKFPIKSFNWIVQSTQNKRVKLDIAQARTKLMASVSNIFWDKLDTKQNDYIFTSIYQALKDIPMYELHFKKEASFWSLIE